jgi:hypothetical protein
MPDQTSPRGDWRTPDFEAVKSEYDRIAGVQRKWLISGGGGAPGGPGSKAAVDQFAGELYPNEWVRHQNTCQG